jgi:hypothetical protein
MKLNPVKFISLILIFINSFGQLQAQLKVGFTGGAVLSTLIRDNNLKTADGQFGYLLGATAKYNIGELGWFVQSGVNYTLEGDSQQKLNFVKVPLTLGLDLGEDVSLYGTYNVAWQVGNENNVQDFYKHSATILGMGFCINTSKHISIGGTLNYGLSNLVSDVMQAKNYSIKPFTFDIYLTYFL